MVYAVGRNLPEGFKTVSSLTSRMACQSASLAILLHAYLMLRSHVVPRYIAITSRVLHNKSPPRIQADRIDETILREFRLNDTKSDSQTIQRMEIIPGNEFFKAGSWKLKCFRGC